MGKSVITITTIYKYRMENQTNTTGNVQTQKSDKPDDKFGFNVDDFVKIIDPDTNEILLAKRG